MRFRHYWAAVAAWLAAGGAHGAAEERQDPAAIRAAVEAYALRETKDFPGRVQLDVRLSEGRLNLAPCDALEPALASGSRWAGKANVAVRCVAGASWTIYVPVQVSVLGRYVVAARTIAANQPIEVADLTFQSGDLSQIGPGAITAMERATGKSLTVGLAAGQPLRQEALRSSIVMQQGQSVKVVSAGMGFTVSAEGKTLTSAREGQIVQVRTTSNQMVSGVARAGGIVEISF